MLEYVVMTIVVATVIVDITAAVCVIIKILDKIEGYLHDT